MRSKKLNFVVASILVALLVFSLWSIIGFTNSKANTEGLTFKGKSNKESYILGEPIKVEFEFINNSATTVIVPKFGVEVGSLKIFIAGENGEYQSYFGPGWGRITGALLNLKPTQSHKFEEVVILCKSVAKVQVFSEPGIYFIKGLSYINGNSTEIESEPIQIIINKPVGDDLEIWNRIKDNRQIAYLMQNDEFNTSKLNDKFDLDINDDDKKAKYIREVEQILEKYPSSTYSSYLEPSLAKFKKSEVRRREFRQQNQNSQEKKP